jgi:RNA polymerase sigma-70 factor, ECF subfamily
MLLPETELIAAARAGSLPAFAQLVALHQKGVRAFLAVRVETPHDADDLAQEVFLIAHRRIAELDAAQPLGPWLRTVAHYLLLNHRRKKAKQPVSATDALREFADETLAVAEAGPDDEERFVALQQCLEQLDAPARELIQLRYQQGLGLAELAERLRRKHSALTMALHRLRQLLRACIEQRLEGSPG